MLLGLGNRCSLCPIGKYSEQSNSEMCSDCGAYHTTAIAGAAHRGWCFEDLMGEALAKAKKGAVDGKGRHYNNF